MSGIYARSLPVNRFSAAELSPRARPLAPGCAGASDITVRGGSPDASSPPERGGEVANRRRPAPGIARFPRRAKENSRASRCASRREILSDLRVHFRREVD